MATAAEHAAAARDAGHWVDLAGVAATTLTDQAKAAAGADWRTFTAWYTAAQVTELAAATAVLSSEAQSQIAALMSEYVGQVTAIARQAVRIEIPKVSTPAVRNGVDLSVVHSRPAETYRDTFAMTLDEDLALERAIERSIRLIEDDLMLAARDAELESMEELGVERYRRVLRPELSESGPCGLCVVASDQIYKIGDLLPLHGRCKCRTMAIIDDVDPGRSVNRQDLKRIYAAAGSTKAADLKRTRVQVREHGELGPVLVVRGQKFTGPEDLGEEPDRTKVEKQLKTLQDNLAALMAMPREPRIDEAIAYQRRRIARAA